MKIVKVQFDSTDIIQKFNKIVNLYPYEIDLKKESYIVDAKSLLGDLYFGAYKILDLIIHENNCEKLLDQIKFCIL